MLLTWLGTVRQLPATSLSMKRDLLIFTVMSVLLFSTPLLARFLEKLRQKRRVNQKCTGLPKT